MRHSIEFYYDILSPYAYLSFCRLPRLIKRSGARLVLKPVSLPRLLEQCGNPPPLGCPPKAVYLRRDTQLLADYYGLPMAWPEVHPQRTGRAMRLLATVDEAQRLSLSRTLFEAIWVTGRDLGQPSELESLLDESLIELADSNKAREQLQANTEELLLRGGFGVPSFLVGDQLLFGNDRLFLLERLVNSA